MWVDGAGVSRRGKSWATLGVAVLLVLTGCGSASQTVGGSSAGSDQPEQPTTAEVVVVPYPEGADYFEDDIAVAAVSADEVWVAAQTSEDQTGADLFRYRSDGWLQVQPDVLMCQGAANTSETSGPAAIVATDGAIWASTSHGLARFAEGSPEQITTIDTRGCVQYPGPDAGVWLRSDAGFLLATPDGAAEEIPLPPGGAAPYVCSWAAGIDGTVLVKAKEDDDDEPCYALRTRLQLWDGTSWRAIDPPDPEVPLWGVLIADDGAPWVISSAESSVDSVSTLSRYADGEWTAIYTSVLYPSVIRAAPGGAACLMLSGLINCFNATGQIVASSPSGGCDFSVAPDGAIWGIGEQITRLAERVPVN